MSRQAGSIVRGNSKPRRISATSGPAAGGGYVLRRRPKVKVAPEPASQNQGLSWRGWDWQEWQGSNLRPPVLETGALPIELHSCEDLASPPIRAVSSIGDAPIARAKRLTGPAVRSGPAQQPIAIALTI